MEFACKGLAEVVELILASASSFPLGFSHSASLGASGALVTGRCFVMASESLMVDNFSSRRERTRAGFVEIAVG